MTAADNPSTPPGTARRATARRRRPSGAKAAVKLAEPPEAATDAPEPSLPALERYQAMDVRILADHPEWVYLWAEKVPLTSIPHVISDEEYAAFQNFRARLSRGDLCDRALRKLTLSWHEQAAKRVFLPRPPFVRVPLTAETPETPGAEAADIAPTSAPGPNPEATEPPLEPLPEETP